MSLDVYLEGGVAGPVGSGIYVREGGSTREISRTGWDDRFPGCEPVTCKNDERKHCYSRNITHNLGTMADFAGIYDCIWRPDEHGLTTAATLIDPLTIGFQMLLADPDKFKKHNPKNGWGDYDGLVLFVADYLEACKANPDATIRVSR